ncbi:MAG: NADP-dependent phosphogluconate dehydrogenase, partial [Steroidobacteraceae bacterium]|nr:NADP-dependent phosphogluconate dehydrogenase [Steroidobacteraceae bacterium]
MEQQIGMVGLGRMGGNMARRLARAGQGVVAWDRAAGARAGITSEQGVRVMETLAGLVDSLPAPRVLWLMLPAGAPTEDTLTQLRGLLAAGDVVVDGANAWYRDSVRRAQELASQGLQFVDAGVSGGVWGLVNGYGLMVGGAAEAVQRVEPFLRALAPAPDRGWLHCGPSGAGHFTKMVHNGIEYGLMQAYAEGLALLRSKEEFQLDVARIAESWRHGTVIRSWLLDLT